MLSFYIKKEPDILQQQPIQIYKTFLFLNVAFQWIEKNDSHHIPT